MVKLKCNYCNNKIKIYKKFYKCINCNKVFKVSNNIFLGLDENFQNNIKNWQDELADNYLEVSAKTVGYRSSTQQNKIINAFFSAFKGIPDGPTLDIGCGHGGFAEKLNKKLNRKLPYYGLDFSFKQLSLGNDNVIKKFNADANNLPFGDDQFNFVFSAEIIQNISKINQIVSEMSRVCMPGGYVGISTLNKHSLFRKILNKVEFWSLYHSKKTYFKARSPNEICKIAKNYDLLLIEIIWIFSPTNILKNSKNINKNKFLNNLSNNFLCVFKKVN